MRRESHLLGDQGGDVGLEREALGLRRADEEAVDGRRLQIRNGSEEYLAGLLRQLGPRHGPDAEGSQAAADESHLSVLAHRRSPERTAAATRSPASEVVTAPPWSYVRAEPAERTPAIARS